MNIADKLIKGDIQPSEQELKFLLWNALIQLSAYCDDVTSVEEESYNIEQMLSTLDVELGAHP
jgi:predicted transposase YdaD